jgi:hypothetical protein
VAKQKKGTCAYCNVVDVPIEDEHVFPASWYPDKHPRDDMLIVPSCATCNREYGKIEARLFLPLVGQLPIDERTDSLLRRALRSIEPSTAPTLREEFFRRRARRAFVKRVQILEPGRENALWTPGPAASQPMVTASGAARSGHPSRWVQPEGP